MIVTLLPRSDGKNASREGPPPFGLDGGVANPGIEYHYERPYPYPQHYEVPHGGGPDIELYDLIDFTMSVGNTGINFVAGLTGWRERDGTALFLPGATDAAYRRAASTLAFMSLVSGQTFAFLRTAQNLTIDAGGDHLRGAGDDGHRLGSRGRAGDHHGVADARRHGVQGRPTGGHHVDGRRAGQLRPRTIRIYPDIPYKAPPPCPPPCPPCPPCP